MASFTCPTCNHKGTVKVVSSDGKALDYEVTCPQCKGTGIVDNYGNSKSF